MAVGRGDHAFLVEISALVPGVDAHPSGQGDIALVRKEVLDGDVGGGERCGAGGLNGQARSPEAQFIRQARGQVILFVPEFSPVCFDHVSGVLPGRRCCLRSNWARTRRRRRSNLDMRPGRSRRSPGPASRTPGRCGAGDRCPRHPWVRIRKSRRRTGRRPRSRRPLSRSWASHRSREATPRASSSLSVRRWIDSTPFRRLSQKRSTDGAPGKRQAIPITATLSLGPLARNSRGPVRRSFLP